MCVSPSLSHQRARAAAAHISAVWGQPIPQAPGAHDYMPGACCPPPTAAGSRERGSSSDSQHHLTRHPHPRLLYLAGLPLLRLTQTPPAVPAAWWAFPAVGEVLTEKECEECREFVLWVVGSRCGAAKRCLSEPLGLVKTVEHTHVRSRQTHVHTWAPSLHRMASECQVHPPCLHRCLTVALEVQDAVPATQMGK